jgi:folylpolyglutamate synthase
LKLNCISKKIVYFILKKDYFGSSQFDRVSWVNSNTDRIDKASGLPLLNTVDLNENFKSGLENCSWPGRNQIIKSNNVTYYLDGAHTADSIEQFISWFKSQGSSGDTQVKNVLLFNFTGERDAATFKKLLEMKFSAVAFSKLNLYPDLQKTMQDNVRKMPMQKLENEDKYRKLIETFLDLQIDRIRQEATTDKNNNIDEGINYKIFDNVQESLEWLTCEEVKSGERLNVLVTGSLYLVGLALKVLEFKMD